MSSTTAMEPVVTMTSTLSMVLATWSRLVPATRDPPVTRTDWTRTMDVPLGPATVCGPGLTATFSAVGDRVHQLALALPLLVCCCMGLAACTAGPPKGPDVTVSTPNVGRAAPPASVQAALSRDGVHPVRRARPG
jgi:hypothetical protein